MKTGDEHLNYKKQGLVEGGSGDSSSRGSKRPTNVQFNIISALLFCDCFGPPVKCR